MAKILKIDLMQIDLLSAREPVNDLFQLIEMKRDILADRKTYLLYWNGVQKVPQNKKEFTLLCINKEIRKRLRMLDELGLSLNAKVLK